MAQAKFVQKTLLTASGSGAGVSTAGGACWVWKLGLGGGGGAVAAAQLVGLLVGFGTAGGGGFA